MHRRSFFALALAGLTGALAGVRGVAGSGRYSRLRFSKPKADPEWPIRVRYLEHERAFHFFLEDPATGELYGWAMADEYGTGERMMEWQRAKALR